MQRAGCRQPNYFPSPRPCPTGYRWWLGEGGFHMPTSPNRFRTSARRGRGINRGGRPAFSPLWSEKVISHPPVAETSTDGRSEGPSLMNCHRDECHFVSAQRVQVTAYTQACKNPPRQHPTQPRWVGRTGGWLFDGARVGGEKRREVQRVDAPASEVAA